jgi:hypothetical protein
MDEEGVLMRFLQWGGLALGGVAGAVVVTCAAVSSVSEYELRQAPRIKPPIAVPTDAASIVESQRLSIADGCLVVMALSRKERMGSMSHSSQESWRRT